MFAIEDANLRRRARAWTLLCCEIENVVKTLDSSSSCKFVDEQDSIYFTRVGVYLQSAYLLATKYSQEVNSEYVQAQAEQVDKVVKQLSEAENKGE